MTFPAVIHIPILLIALFVGVSVVDAQETVHVRGDPECESCRIEVEPVATIGSLEGPGYLSGVPNALTADSRGRYFVRTVGASHEIKVYTSNGAFLTRIGEEGQGPGEFLSIRSLLSSGRDSLFAFDGGNGRVAVYGPTLNLVREFLLPVRIEYAPVAELSTGRLVINATIRSSDLIGLPLQLVERDGDILRSFGSEHPIYRADSPMFQVRETSSAHSGGVWSAPKVEYVIERWSASGALHQRIVRSTPWFEPYVHFVDPTPNRPPSPVLQSIREDRSGRLWVAVAVPAPNFDEGLSEPIRGEGGRSYSRYEDYGKVYDTIIEVFEASSGRLLAHRRIPEYALRWVRDGELATYREPNGVPLLDIWRITLVEPVEP